MKKLLVANRGEIAIRVFRAAYELGLSTVAVYAKEDEYSVHRFKADESYLIGEGKKPIEAYLDMDSIIKVALECGADAIHPGYGLLSENLEFATKVRNAGLIFVGQIFIIWISLAIKLRQKRLLMRLVFLESLERMVLLMLMVLLNLPKNMATQ